MKEITTDELKARVEAGDPIAVVDIRDAEAYADWHIPGSMNVPVIQAMRANDPAPLQARAGELPRHQPIVVVCNQGVSSLKAAAALEPLGFDVASLAGGMREWSIVHSEARLDIGAHPGATFIQIRRNGKGCLSYLIGSNGTAAVVDPAVQESVYVRAAQREGLRISHVLETHVHADHISRARALCTAVGAQLLMAPNDRVTFGYTAITDGQDLCIGDVSIEAVATPGHTGESTSFLIAGEALLTGDTLFVDSVGRPDLEKGDAGAEAGARRLHDSLHDRILALPDDIRIYPAHAGSAIGFDGVPVGARLGDLRSRLELFNVDETSFVEMILAGLGPKPPSFQTVINLNEGKADLGETDPLDIEAGPNRCAVR
ncbi:MAG: MBL fold metallo-hydrolase [Planctomycetota bacterium]|jgi:glyoxylase-like metal-dependent hydrolase (beta-lactamase superfamily II)